VFSTIGLLAISNAFMTYAWYGHLKTHQSSKLWVVILLSWSIAFLEYCFQVPANRIGIKFFTLGQLKVIQEIISMSVFALFSVWYMKVPLTKNFAMASLCLVLAAYFIFKDGMHST
jgi:uncharacterized protein (DUF486 family)